MLRVTTRGAVILDGGVAAGLNPGSELVRSGERPPLRLEVTSVSGLGQASAAVVAGDLKTVRSGSLFRLDRWVAPASASLRIALPPQLPAAKMAKVLATLAALRTEERFDLATDPTGPAPTHHLFLRGGSWFLDGPLGNPLELGAELESAAVLRGLGEFDASAPRPLLFASLPAPAPLATALLNEVLRSKGSLELRDSTHADYALIGRATAGGASYAWVRPRGDEDPERAVLPTRTDWFDLAERDDPEQTATDLARAALRVAELRTWLTLESPPDDGSFPYHLVLRNDTTHRLLGNGDAFEGEEFALLLERDAGAAQRSVQQRYIYVVALDSHGRRSLLFPSRGAGNSENRLPAAAGQSDDPSPQRIRLGDRRIRIAPPFGTDTLVTLTSLHPLADPGVLEGAPVRTRDANPLSDHLSQVGRAAGGRTPLPVSWGIERVAIHSRAR